MRIQLKMLRKFMKLTLNNNYSHLKYCSRVKCYTTETNQERKTLKGGSDVILNKYSDQDVEQILKIVNSYNLKDLLSYDISKARANKLLAWRMRNGLLTNLSDIFLIEGFGLKMADKFYQSLLQEPKPNVIELGKLNRVRTAPFISPSMEAEQKDNVRTCVGVRIGVNSITWSKLDISPADNNQPCQLTHWHHHEISEKKLHLHELIQRCLYVTHLIPQADCYLFENPQMAQASNNPGSADQQNINIQKAQVTAMMGYALAARNPPQLEQAQQEEKGEDEMKVQRRSSIFYVRRFLTARLFNHLVGTERVSSEQTILNMMRTYYNIDEMPDSVNTEDCDVNQPDEEQKLRLSFRGNVQFPMELRHMFSSSPRYHREFLGQALLLNLAFVRLVLLQDSESIAQVTRGGGKTKNESCHM